MAKSNSFVKQMIQIGGSTFINLLIGLFTTPIITRIVEPNDYGRFSLFNTYSSIVMIVFCLGLDQALVRYFYSQDDDEYKKRLFRFCIKFPMIAISALSVGMVLTFSKFQSIGAIDNWLVLILFIFNLFVMAFNRISILLVRLRYHSGTYSILNIVHKAAYVVLVILAAMVFKREYFLILVVATVLSALLVTIISVISEKEFYITKIQRKNLGISIKTILTYSVPLMIASCVFYAFQAIDKLSINHYLTYTDVGVYSSAQSLMQVFAVVQTTFNLVWSPKAVEHYEKKPNDTEFFSSVHKMMVIVMFLFGTTVLLCKDLIVLLLGAKYREAAFVIPFLMFNPIMYTLSETTVNGLYFKEKSYWHVVITITSCVVNIIGNSLLIPRFGISGAAISTGLSYIVFFELRTFLANRYYKVNYGLERTRIILLLTVVFAVKCMNSKTDIITCIMYLIIVLAIAFLYHKTIRFMWNYFITSLIDKIKNVRRNINE